MDIDIALFRFINDDLANPFFDLLFPSITEFRHWLPVYILASVWLVYRQKWRGALMLLYIVAGVTLADQVSAKVIKELVARERPCRELEGVRLLAVCGAGKSFPSNHAVNNFFGAVFLGLIFRRQLVPLCVTALLVALSRVYIGVHYPADIAGGALFGALVGFLMYRLFSLTEKRLFTKKETVPNA